MCWKCGNNYTGTIGRTTLCPVCGADLHCCKNCRYYAPGSHYDCHETIDENVTDKEKSNFCDNFKMNENAGKLSSAETLKAKQDAAKKAFDSLFSI